VKEISDITHQQGKSIIIFGSPSIAQLMMQNDLIDTYWIFVNPTIFGKGIPLFTELKNKIELEFVESKQFANGEFEVRYSRANQ
jgi:dihydrofolate reductase